VESSVQLDMLTYGIVVIVFNNILQYNSTTIHTGIAVYDYRVEKDEVSMSSQNTHINRCVAFLQDDKLKVWRSERIG
jgi:hypothetical protein